MERKNAWLTYDEAQLEELKQLNEGYKDFLSKGKTERECVKIAVQMAKEAGYQDLNEVKSLKPGDKVYAAAMGKMIILYQIGKQPLEQGMNILGAHIDSPRLDLKQIRFTKIRIWRIWIRITMAELKNISGWRFHSRSMVLWQKKTAA